MNQKKCNARLYVVRRPQMEARNMLETTGHQSSENKNILINEM